MKQHAWSKPPWPAYVSILMALVGIAENLVGLFTLGYLWPAWAYKVCMWAERRRRQHER